MLEEKAEPRKCHHQRNREAFLQCLDCLNSRNSSYSFSSVSAGKYHSCAVLVNGSVMCWGADGGGVLGNGATSTVQPNPVLVATDENFTQIDIDVVQNQYKDYMILTTSKDLVKLEKFNIKNLILMDMHIEFDEKVNFSHMENYIKSFDRID